MSTIAVEIDGRGSRSIRNDDAQLEEREVDLNVNWFFRPLQFSLRGKFDMSRAIDNNARAKSYSAPIVPGQRLILDIDKRTGTIIEPLRDEANAHIVKRIGRFLGHPIKVLLEDDPLQVGPRETVRELTDPRDVPTWLYWIRRGVESGCCRIISGKLPDKIEGKPRKVFNGHEPYEDPVIEMTRQQQALAYATMTPDQRTAYDRKLAELREQAE